MDEEQKKKIQTKLVIGEEAVKEQKEKLGIPEAIEGSMCKVGSEERPYVTKEATSVTMDNYMMVTGNLEENNLKLTVVTVFNLNNAKTLPDVVMTENEIDVWRQHLQSNIAQNSDMLAKALTLIVR